MQTRQGVCQQQQEKQEEQQQQCEHRCLVGHDDHAKERKMRTEAEWIMERAVIRRMCHVLVVLCLSDDTFDPVHHVLHIDTDNAVLRCALHNAARETGIWGLAANSARELALDKAEQAAARLLGVEWHIAERCLADCLAETKTPATPAAPGS
ncbi:uncharacterized protein ACA1_324990 [Acanthamoeba castellanii str. Neff]|uniref:Uncharacterized protein n=1 Tax=Acanthamoeba castellanii (strain ATCC 30010 / Neff) TaxID=1257118 RepID=L8GHI5_ACACF|nr:uncharacterized protein ACA1_324990 [Acanthamoeba castellanii str. Neff]ELR12452.1 hypothetical protein ACA1_324990 [Acanthamoeba castellanii str. Neff]